MYAIRSYYDTFLQRIPGSESVLIVGPVPYLSFLHAMRWFDVGLLLLLGLSLGLPILLWMRPHWRGLQALVTARITSYNVCYTKLLR